MPWQQTYDPLHQPLLSALVAFLPAVILLVCLGVLRIKAHLAALIGLAPPWAGLLPPTAPAG